MTVSGAQQAFQGAESLRARCARLERELAREKAARRSAEDIAEHGLRALYLGQERLKLLTKVASFANDCNDPKVALRFAVDEVCTAAGWPVGHALIRAGLATEQKLTGTDIWSLHDAQRFFPFMDASQNLIALPGTFAPGMLFTQKSAIWTADIHGNPSFSRSKAARRCGLISSVTIPVLVNQDLVAAIEFFQTDAIKPETEMLEVLQEIGSQIGRVFNRKRHADMMMRSATTDPLTELPNRMAFEQFCNHQLRAEDRHEHDKMVLLYMDLDGFKLVNDTLGHAAGDTLLVAMTERLRGIVAAFEANGHVKNIFLARLSGDEFVIMVKADMASSIADDIAAEVHRCLQPSYRIGNNDVHAMASIGIAHDRPDYNTIEELMRDADVAMYQAKSVGPGKTAIFTNEMRDEAMRRLTLQAELRAAIEFEEFELHYQPIVSLADRSTIGFEALVRWRRKPDELVMPDAFIGLAETSGLIIPIGTWIFREACRAVLRLRQTLAGRSPVYVSINVAAQQFQQLNFLQLVRDILLETGTDPSLVRLELTESSAIANPEYARQTVEKLRAMGIAVSLDDFGTGYSSLAYLQSIPFDTIKIDSCFVRKQCEANADWSIVSAVKLVADSMGMTVIAEGIENEFQLSELKTIGLQYGQGYLFQRPMPEAHVAGWLA